MKCFLALKLIILIISLIKTLTKGHEINNKPPIYGIIMQESDVAPNIQEVTGNMISLLQSGGCFVVPILIHQKRDYYLKLFKSINGVIFPGGFNLVVDIDHSNFSSTGYVKAGKIMFDLAVEANNRGDYFPIFASCMGCQLLTYLASKQKLMRRCDAQSYATKLNFNRPIFAVKKTKLFKDADTLLIKKLATEIISYQSHSHCLSPYNFTEANLGSIFDAISTNYDRNGIKFITLLEAKNYPFYCSFIHPEITLFGTNPRCKSIPRTGDAVIAAQYFSRFLRNEARKNFHSFKDKQLKMKSLIFAFNATYADSNSCSPIIYYIKIKKSHTGHLSSVQ